MENIAKHYDRLIACLPFRCLNRTHVEAKRQLLEPTTRVAGTLLATLGASGFVFLATHTRLGRLRPTLNAVTICSVSSGMILGYKYGYLFHCDGGNGAAYGDTWEPSYLPEQLGRLLKPSSISSGHKLGEMDLNRALGLGARTFFSGVGLAALGTSVFDVVSAVRAGLKIRGTIAGMGICLGIGHNWLWQTTNGSLPFGLENDDP